MQNLIPLFKELFESDRIEDRRFYAASQFKIGELMARLYNITEEPELITYLKDLKTHLENYET